MEQPLAYRMRPTKIEEIVGQQHLVGEGKIIWRMVAAKRLSSMILYGPPVIGKTSIASAIAGSSKVRFSHARLRDGQDCKSWPKKRKCRVP